MRAENDFDLIAPFYDVLQRLVFGQTLQNVQRELIPLLNPGRVLIVGGGTGKIFRELPHHDDQITYVDNSRSMIKRASTARPGLHFACQNYLDFKASNSFESVISPFFLDVFDADHLTEAIQKMWNELSKGGKLLVCDFQKTNSKPNNALLWAMHRFFRLTVRLQSPRIQPIHSEIEKIGFNLLEERIYRRGMIFSRLYQK